MITYLGNKRKLVDGIEKVVARLRPTTCADAFSGSGVVSRCLLTYCDTLYVNDQETYCQVLSQCFLCAPESRETIATHLDRMNACDPVTTGLFSDLYAPKDSENIQDGERCFYTKENANRIDAMLAYVETEVPTELRPYCLGPLLVKASIHTNTSGVFKGFHKGGWGGRGGHALERIKRPIEVECPVWLDGPKKDVSVYTLDAIDFLLTIPPVDLVYLDPPYNQHPYGSNYFMLNLVCTNKRPETISKVSGIPTGWNKSAFNSRRTIRSAMDRLIRVATEKAKYTLVSYSSEGFITPDEWETLLEPYTYEKIETVYSCYKGSRHLAERQKTVTEFLFIITAGKDMARTCIHEADQTSP